MYTSKYYTCEQIDQRLLQGQYDDAVAHGFTGNIAEFWEKILGIPGIITALSDLKNDLRTRHDELRGNIQSYKAESDALSSAFTQLRGDLTAEIGRSTNADMNIMNMFSNVNTQLEKIQPLTEEEVNTLVNDALES